MLGRIGALFHGREIDKYAQAKLGRHTLYSVDDPVEFIARRRRNPLRAHHGG
jgi:hypothetical protein